MTWVSNCSGSWVFLVSAIRSAGLSFSVSFIISPDIHFVDGKRWMLVHVCDLTLILVLCAMHGILLGVGISIDRYTMHGIVLSCITWKLVLQEKLGCVIAETIIHTSFSLLRQPALTWREPYLLPHWRAWSTSSQKKGKCWPSLFLMCANWYCLSLVSPYYDSAGKVGQPFRRELHYTKPDKGLLVQKLVH